MISDVVDIGDNFGSFTANDQNGMCCCKRKRIYLDIENIDKSMLTHEDVVAFLVDSLARQLDKQLPEADGNTFSVTAQINGTYDTGQANMSVGFPYGSTSFVGIYDVKPNGTINKKIVVLTVTHNHRVTMPAP